MNTGAPRPRDVLIHARTSALVDAVLGDVIDVPGKPGVVLAAPGLVSINPLFVAQ